MSIIKEVYRLFRYIIKWILFYHKFEKVGFHTVIRKPFIVENVKNVRIGDWVSSLPGLRIQTYNKYNEVMSQYVEIIATDSLVIEDNVSIGQFAMINTSLHGYMEKDVPIGQQDLISAPIRIGEGSHIGAGAMILPGANVGKFCVIGANCVINKSIQDYTVVSPQKPRMAVLPHAVRKKVKEDIES